MGFLDGAVSSAGSGAAFGGPIGAGVGIASSILPQLFGLLTGGKQRKQAAEAARRSEGFNQQAMSAANNGLDVAKQNYAQALNAYNGRMPGAANYEQNIANAQGGATSSLQRNATDASQLLALAGGVQGNSDNAYANLASQEGMNKLYQGQNLQLASGGLQSGYGNLQNLNYEMGRNAQDAATQLGQNGQVNQFNALKGFGNIAMNAAQGNYSYDRKSPEEQSSFQSGALGSISNDNLIPLNAPGINLSTPYVKRKNIVQ